MDRPFAAYTGDEPYIFVSYAHEDDEIVYPEIQWLKDQGFNIWYDEGISPGTEWRAELSDSIKESSLFLYFITPKSVASNHCLGEVNLATDYQKQILAVYMEETELPSGMDLTLSTIQAILRHEISNHAYRTKLITGVSAHLQRGIAQANAVPTTANKSRSWLLPFNWLAFLVASVAASWLYFSVYPSIDLRRESTKTVRFKLSLPEGVRLSPMVVQPLQISADDKWIVFNGSKDGQTQLYHRRMDQIKWRRISGTEHAGRFVLSQTGDQILFKTSYSNLDSPRVMKVPVNAERSPVEVFRHEEIGEITWGGDKIVFDSSPPAHNGLLQVSDKGGNPEILTSADQNTTYAHHEHPYFLPDGKTLLYVKGALEANDSMIHWIYALNVESRVEEKIVDGYSPRFIQGYLLFVRADSVWSVELDYKKMELIGSPVKVLTEVSQTPDQDFTHYYVSERSLVYKKKEHPLGHQQLIWVNRSGEIEETNLKPGNYIDPAISPDGRLIAVEDLANAPLEEIHLIDILRRSSIRFAVGYSPLWSEDGKVLYFVRRSEGRWLVISKQLTGGDASEKILLEHEDPIGLLSRTSNEIFFASNQNGVLRAGVLELDGDPKTRLLFNNDHDEFDPYISPDGRWLLYVSTEDGYEIMLTRYPNVAGEIWQVSPEGERSSAPLWSPSGKEIYYQNSDRAIFAVSFKSGLNVEFGEPRELFALVKFHDLSDISPDGQKFLTLKDLNLTDETDEIIVVLDWIEELKQAVRENIE